MACVMTRLHILPELARGGGPAKLVEGFAVDMQYPSTIHSAVNGLPQPSWGRIDQTAAWAASAASSSSATMFVILIIGLTAGPAVSLYGSPTVSPVTAALWASDPLPPWGPSSMYFLALSQAPPPVVIETATKKPVTITPSSIAPSAEKAAALPAMASTPKYTTSGASTGSMDGMIISRMAALVSRSTAR